MDTKRQILWDHYTGLLRKVASWAGLIAIMSTVFVSFPASAVGGQLTARKVALSDSGGAATAVSYDQFFTNFTTSGALGIKAIRFQYCTSPLYNTTCNLPSGLVRGTTIGTQTNNGGAMTNAFSAATSGTTDVLLTNATGNTFTSGQIVNIKLTGFTNPTAVNTEYYVRVIVCTTTTCTMGGGDNTDFGSMAVSTGQQLSVTASVQEDLTFCVGVTITAACGTVGSGAVPLTPAVMGVSTISTATAKMAASTNATSGYTIQYVGSTFADTTADTIALAASGGTAVGALPSSSEQFGFNLVANSGGNFGTVGANFSGGTGITIASGYNTNNTIAYTTAGGATSQVASASGATAMTTYTISYGCEIASTTKPGAYTATQTFIATGTF